MIPIELATKISTRNINEQIVRIDRLIISFGKIVTSFHENATEDGKRKVQTTHLQVIENIFYQDAHLFDEKMAKKFIDEFFSLKDRLDSNVLELPLTSDKYMTFFTAMLVILGYIKKNLQFRAKRKKMLLILLWCVLLGIIIPGGLIIFLGQVIDSSLWKFIVSSISNLFLHLIHFFEF